MKQPKRSRSELNSSDVSSQSSGEAKSGRADEEHLIANANATNRALQEEQRTTSSNDGRQLPSTSSETALTSRSMFFAEQRELDRDLREIVARVQVQQEQRGQVGLPIAGSRNSENVIPPEPKRSRSDAQNSDVSSSQTGPINEQNHHFDPDELEALNAANTYTEDPPSPDPGNNP